MNLTSVFVCIGLLTVTPAFAEVDVSKLPPAAAKQGVTFENDILPIFKASCVGCHGAQRPKAGLRLDSLEAALKGSKEGKVVVAGDSAKSPLVVAVARIDDETAMPPKRQPRGNRQGDGGGQPQGPPPKPLTPEQVGLVRAWIDQGAK